MSLYNPAILFGLAALLLPILLHLLMRARPKKLPFPALQLIKVRRRSNARRLRLRHIWLLLLRTLVLALLILAIARPALPAANYGLNLREGIMLAVIVAAMLGVYWLLTRSWQRKRLLGHEYAWRRSLACGGTGTAGVLLFLLLVAWPWQRRIAAEITAPLPDVVRNLPVAAIYVFDGSASMEYRQGNLTRMQVAQDIAGRHLRNLPSQSRVAVTDTVSDRDIVFQADLVSAKTRVENLKTSAVGRSLNSRLAQAIDLQVRERERTRSNANGGSEDLYIREIYLLTDLARSAWSMSSRDSLRDRLQELPWLHVYLIDLGVDDPINMSLARLRLSDETANEGGSLTIEAVTLVVGMDGDTAAAELFLHGTDGMAFKQGRQSIDIVDGAARLAFHVSGLKAPFVQGEIRLNASDPLAVDDVLYFTVHVKPAPEILIVGESRDECRYLEEALAPEDFVRQDLAPYRCHWMTPEEAVKALPGNFQVVCMVNVLRPSDELWSRLESFVRNGRGLAIVCGRGQPDLDPVAYNTEAAERLLPAELRGSVRFLEGPAFIHVSQRDHPLFKSLVEFPQGLAEFRNIDVRRAWSVRPRAGADVLADYEHSRRLPAIVERVVGTGRVIMVTTAMDYLDPGGKDWNDLTLHWPFLVLADQMMKYLGQRTDSTFNVVSGRSVSLRLGRASAFERYLLRHPRFEQIRGEVPLGAEALVLNDLDDPGHYEVLDAQQPPRFRSGFSVNLPESESDLSRLTSLELDELLGEDNYSRARRIEELDRAVRDMRIGREVAPLLILLATIVFCGEHLVANWFYRAEPSSVRGHESPVA